MTDRVVLITGASRGLGLGMAEKFASRGLKVFAAARHPEKAEALKKLQKKFEDRIFLIAMDVDSDASVENARKEVFRSTDHIDILINNAGRYAKETGESLAEVDFDQMHKTYETNVLGPLRVSKAFWSLMRAGKEKKLVHITSQMGSIEENKSGGTYDYRLSKAALNMLNKNLSIDLAADGVISVALHPGWVRTDMGGPEAPMDVETSVSKMTECILSLKPEQNGAFIRFDGKNLPY
ncbi:MAG: SDR family oxidoreductase [Pseudomonadota bacterium]